jgi:hypothetical protein
LGLREREEGFEFAENSPIISLFGTLSWCDVCEAVLLTRQVRDYIELAIETNLPAFPADQFVNSCFCPFPLESGNACYTHPAQRLKVEHTFLQAM